MSTVHTVTFQRCVYHLFKPLKTKQTDRHNCIELKMIEIVLYFHWILPEETMATASLQQQSYLAELTDISKIRNSAEFLNSI